MANVLPPEYKDNITTEYRFRLAAVGFLLFGIGLAISAGFLVPSYLLLNADLSTTRDQIAAVQETFREDGGGGYTKIISDTKRQMEALAQEERDVTIGAMFQSVLQNKNQGIALTRFSYKQRDDVLSVSGVANTRQSLLSFEEALAQSDQFTNVNLPVSSLANQTNISFSLDLKLADMSSSDE